MCKAESRNAGTYPTAIILELPTSNQWKMQGRIPGWISLLLVGPKRLIAREG
jgi:hypothetical protein